MSTTYKDLPGTNYPDGIDTFENKIDANAAMYPFVQQYKELFSRGNVAAARALLDTYPQLKSMIIAADDFNKLQDAMIAMERFVKRDQQQIIFSATEPTGETVQAVGDVWVKLTSTGAEMYQLTEDGYVLRFSNTAVKLQTARKIGNALFDGTKDITLAQIGAATSAQGTKIDNLTTEVKYIKKVSSLPANPDPTTLYLIPKG